MIGKVRALFFKVSSRVMATIHIKGWDESQAYNTLAGWHARHLEQRFMEATRLPRRQVRPWVRQLKQQECISIPLPRIPNALEAYSLRSFLESVGALVEVTDE
jgi:hypothetical protein